nr:uncharacterized protein LOC115258038 [Aedes albopictus]
MEQHLQTFSDLLQRIADVCDPIPEKLQVAMLLCSLPDSYDYLATALEQRPRDELKMQLVESKLLAEAEKRRERGEGKQSGHLRRDCPQNATGVSATKPEEPKAKQVQDVTEYPLAWMVGQADPTSWFIDSGASRHMTGNRQFFTVLEKTGGTSVMLRTDRHRAE